MVEIKGTKITMTRGDTLRTHVLMTDSEGNEYTPQEGDVIRFAMKKTYEDKEPLILKVIPHESMTLTLDPEDTKSLPAPASFVYDIEITYADGAVDTFINKAKLTLTEEVH